MSRSPSRDLVDRYAGNRGYFHRGDPVRRAKTLAALAGLGLVFGWAAYELAFAGRAAAVHTHGELANPHAAWGANCEACHRPHAAGEFLGDPFSAFDARARWHDLSCTMCHAGPAHHAAADAGAHERCSTCHHDHRGRDHSLVRLSDAHCTSCHADLTTAHAARKPGYAAGVTNFATDHPEFRALRTGLPDRGVKFSHALHMTPGLVYDPADKHPWTPAVLGRRFGPDSGTRYTSPGRKDTDPVALTCAACHQPDAAGADYRPVHYEAHCQTCHPIRTPAGVSGGVTLKEFAVPHRKQPGELMPLLKGEYAGRLAPWGNPALAALTGPGGRLDPRPPHAADFYTEVDRLSDAALDTLLLGLAPAGEEPPRATGGYACGKCHYAAKPADRRIAAVPERAVRFEHAAFDHASHRGLTCASCHPGTEAAFAPNGRVNEREPVLMSGIQSCRACHAPAGTPVELPARQTVAAAGIRHGCTDCHTYHHGDRPRQGRGAPARDPVERLDLGAFLKGRKGN